MTTTHDKAPMSPERRARIAETWQTVVKSGAVPTLLKKGFLEVYMVPVMMVGVASGRVIDAPDVREKIKFTLGTPRGKPAYEGIPVLCEDEEFGVVHPA